MANTGNQPYCDVCALNYARKYNLVTTAGSDNHNAQKADPVRLMGVSVPRRLKDAKDYAALLRSRGPVRPIVPEGRFDLSPDEMPRLVTYWIDEDDPDFLRKPTCLDFRTPQ